MNPIKKNRKKVKEKSRLESDEEEDIEEIRKKKNKKKSKINSDSNSDSNESSSDSKDKKENKIKLIDSKKSYKYESTENFQKDKSPFKGKKIFSTEKKKNNQEKNSNKNKIKNESSSNSDLDSDSKNKEDSSSSSREEIEQKKEKINKKKESSSSSSSSSSDSNSPPHSKKQSSNEIYETDLNSTMYKEKIEKIKIINKMIPISKNIDNKFLKDKKENEVNIKILLDDISKNLKSCKGKLEKEMEEIYKHKDFFEKKNFILTDLSCKRMAQIIHYIKSGNPVLLEGDTGTAKTRTSVIACEYLKYMTKYIVHPSNSRKKFEYY